MSNFQFVTYFSHRLGLTVEKSGTFLHFPNGVEVDGLGNNHDKGHECEKEKCQEHRVPSSVSLALLDGRAAFLSFIPQKRSRGIYLQYKY